MCAKAQAGRRRPWATHLPQPHVAKLRAFLVEPEPGASRAAHVLLRAVEPVDRGRVKVRLPAPHGAVKHECSNTRANPPRRVDPLGGGDVSSRGARGRARKGGARVRARSFVCAPQNGTSRKGRGPAGMRVRPGL
jgi:hypothetical protein